MSKSKPRPKPRSQTALDPKKLPGLPVGIYDDAGHLVQTFTIPDPREAVVRHFNAIEKIGLVAKPLAVS